jgi:hypothetical protein
VDYLNAGGTPDALAAALEAQNLGPLEGPPFLAGDFTGDRLEDLALAVLAPTNSQAGGTLLILECVGQAYRIAYEAATEAPDETPVLHFAQDLTADGVPDLVAAHRLCGAHTCFQQVMVITWVGLAFENRLQGASDDLPYPVVKIVGPDETDGYALSVSGTGIGSAGAGPYRQRARTWSWDPTAQALLPGPDVLLPSEFRIHVLLDADAAAFAGEYSIADDLYLQVMTDEALEDVEFSPSPRENLAAYAAYRRLLGAVLAGFPPSPSIAYGELEGTFPEGAPGHAYVELADAFLDGYTSSQDIAAGCAAAQAYAEAHRDEVLGPLHYGYANPAYTAEDVCPFG